MPKGVYKHKKLTKEHKRRIGLAHLGMKRSDKTKNNISMALTGRKLSKETRKKISLVHLGKKHSEEHKLKIRLAMKGIKKSPRTQEYKQNMRLAKLGKPHILTDEGLKSFKEKTSGENNFRWIKDRTKLKDNQKDRGGQLHRDWSRRVKNRDGWKCKICDCNGNLIAHHILGWTTFPELRYDINNGITLCHAHHPRKRAEEAKLSPFFKQLVAEMK